MPAHSPLSTLADAGPWHEVAHATAILSGIIFLCKPIMGFDVTCLKTKWY